MRTAAQFFGNLTIGLAGKARFQMVKNEFEVVHVPRFRQADIFQFAETVDLTHKIYESRCGKSWDCGQWTRPSSGSRCIALDALQQILVVEPAPDAAITRGLQVLIMHTSQLQHGSRGRTFSCHILHMLDPGLP